MSRTVTHVLPFLLLGVVVTVIGGAVAYSVAASAKPSEGPFDVVWDKAACAACGMHVGEPGFAAQLTTKDGHEYSFDDPGCMFLFVAEQHPDVHSMFFHHNRENRWIPANDVGFVAIEKTPMGFGIAAVAAGTKDSIGLDEARRKCLERTSGHGGK